ncbi:hypothetical protein CAOG_04510 [Capsaspora owczarzaki ATCC 30864]|nr:hypothetical protein CAOG_04510 [Capsaspora owczarzaki ATCC 30864]|eukprot:XP_004347257.1 hypothetical protein CAOG_04510 [Capsaspora owczarzaki ATCC 30864]
MPAVAKTKKGEANKALQAQTRQLENTLFQQKKLASAETDDNALEQARQNGKFLTYGMTVQLYHSFSNKFVAGSASDPAWIEDTNMRVELHQYNSKLCWFRVMPRYKVRAEGDIVRKGDQIVFESIKTPASFLHASHDPFDDAELEAGLHEVNMSVTPSAFSIFMYSRPDETWAMIAASSPGALIEEGKDEKESVVPVRFGDCIRLFHRELEAYVAAEGTFGKTGVAEVPHLRVRHVTTKRPHSLKPPSGPSVFWQIEMDSGAARGGRMRWEQLVRLRHFTTRQFLAVKLDAASGEPVVTLTSDHRDADAVFRLHAVIRDRQNIEYGSFTRIEHPLTKTWLHGDATLSYARQGTVSRVDTLGADAPSPAAAAAIESCKPMTEIRYDKAKLLQLTASRESHYDDAFTITQAKQKDINNVNFVAGILPALKWYAKSFRAAASKDKPRELTAETAAYLCRAMDLLAKFVVDKDTPNKRRQKVLRHLRCVDALIEVIRVPFSPYNPDGFPISELRTPDKRLVRDVCSAAYNALNQYVQGESRKSEMYIARFIPFMLGQVGSGLPATDILTQLASDNMSIVNRIKPPLLDFFIGKLKEQRASRYLKFLATCCAVKGGANYEIQSYICENLLGGVVGNPVILPVSLRNGVLHVDLLRDGLVVPVNELADDAKSLEAEYLLEQINFLRRLCIGRNKVTIPLLRDELKCVVWAEVFAAVKDTELNPVYRIAYADLLHQAFVDIEPYEDLLERIQLTFDAQTLTQRNSSATECTTAAHLAVQNSFPPELTELRSWINTTIANETSVIATRIEENKFIEAILTLARSLVSFGVYNNRTQLLELLCPLIRLLDCSDDYGNENKDNKEEQQEYLRVDRLLKNPENKSVANLKFKGLEIIELMMNFRFAARLEEFFWVFKQLESHDLVGKGHATLHRAFGKNKHHNHGLEPELLELAPLTKTVIPAARLKPVLAALFKNTEFIDALGPELPIIPVLLDCANYGYTKLATQAHYLITRLYSASRNFFQMALDGQVLTLPESVDAFKIIRQVLPSVRRMARSKIGEKQAERLSVELDRLAKLLYLKDDPHEPHRTNQTILTNAGIVIDLLGILGTRIELGKREKGGGSAADRLAAQELEKKNAAICKLFGQCFKVLGLLARRNTSMQDYLFDRLDFLLNHEGAEKDKARMLVSVFKGNQTNCLRIKEKHIQLIVELLAETELSDGSKVFEYLQLLGHIAKVEDANLTLKRNQSAIIKYMMQHREDTIINVDDAHNDERIALLQSSAEKPSRELLYHIELVDLLATCAEGENRFIESMCQTIFSPEELLQVFTDPKIPVLHKAPYLRFLVWVYLATASTDIVSTAEMLHNDDFWTFVGLLSDHLKAVTGLLKQHKDKLKALKDRKANNPQAQEEVLDDPVPEDDMDFIMEGIVPFARIFYESQYSAKDATAEQNRVSVKFAESLLAFSPLASIQVDEIALLQSVTDCLLVLSNQLSSHAGLSDDFEAKLNVALEKNKKYGTSGVAGLSDAVKDYLRSHEQEREANERLNTLVVNLCQSYESDPICPYLGDEDAKLPLGEEFQRHIELFAEYNSKKEFKGLNPNIGRMILTLDVSAKTSHTLSEKELLEQQKLDTRSLQLLRGIVEVEKARRLKADASSEDKEEAWDQIAKVQSALNKYEAALISTKMFVSDDDEIVIEALATATAILDGGNKEVQRSFEKFFLTSREETFFADIRSRIVKSMATVKEQRALVAQKEKEEQKRKDLTATHATHAQHAAAPAGDEKSSGEAAAGSGVGDIELTKLHGAHEGGGGNAVQEAIEDQGFAAALAGESGEDALNDMMDESERELSLVLRLLQLLCEGNNVVLKNYIREQGDNIKSYNLVSDTANYLNVLYHNVSSDNIELVSQVLESLVEFCQGNGDNQIAVFDAKCLDGINHIFRQHEYTGMPCPQVAELKLHAANLVLTMLEEQTEQAIQLSKELHTQLDIRAIHENMTRYHYEHQHSKHLGYTAEHPEPADVAYVFYNILASLSDFTTTNYNAKPYTVKPSTKGGKPEAEGSAKSDKVKLETNIKLINVSYTGTVHGSVRLGSVSSKNLTALAHGNKNAAKTFKVLPSKLYVQAPSAYAAIQGQSGSIEVLRNDILSKVHFRVRNRDALRPAAKERLLWTVDRSSPTDKIRDFISQCQDIRDEMKYQEQLLSNPISSFFVRGSPFFYWGVLLVTLLLNIFILVSWSAPTDPTDWRPNTDDWYNPLLYIFGGIHVALSACTFIEFFLTHPPTRPQQFLTLAPIYYILFLGMSIAGITVRGYFFCFHLLHVVVGNDLLQRVIQSVTKNGRSLLWVTALGVIVIYIYAIASFAFLRADFDASRADGAPLFCNTMWQCFLTSLNFGLENGLASVGIADVNDWQTVGLRVLYDLSFFVLISTIGLNVIFGIIVDTFSELRDEKWQIEADMAGNCFICSIKAYDFEKYTKGFIHHTKNEHNMWNYLFYTIHLHEKAQDDLTALELYCMDKIKKVDTSMFPINRAMSLQKSEDALEVRLENLTRMVKSLVDRFEKDDRVKAVEAERRKQQAWEAERTAARR